MIITISVLNCYFSFQIDVAQFTSTIHSFRPNVVECLCDTIPSNGQTPKRIKKSVDRTLKYLDEIIKYKEENKVSEIGTVGRNSLNASQGAQPFYLWAVIFF
jgi:hypothetical protein